MAVWYSQVRLKLTGQHYAGEEDVFWVGVLMEENAQKMSIVWEQILSRCYITVADIEFEVDICGGGICAFGNGSDSRVRKCFSEINSDPGYVNKERRLRILPYYDFNKSPHGCSLCPPNMSKKVKDFVMPRKNFPVWDLICKDPSLIKAEIHKWSDGKELEQVLMQLINQASLEESNQISSADCKLHNLSLLVKSLILATAAGMILCG
ncbi:hypothetical protein Fmac_019876 [Flemingia macrophylla]|uniref:Uncharacterized protein n=1 Tax=Flemingia macrophylla TaxID=520843 RepID=A0ABD1M916_9FABA